MWDIFAEEFAREALMSSQHKHAPISLRLPEGDRAWLLDYAETEGLPVNQVLVIAVRAYRAGVEQAHVSA